MNTASDYVIERNIFDRCAFRLLHLVAKEKESCPVMRGNTYIQYEGGMLGQYGANSESEPPILIADEDMASVVREVFGDVSAITHIIPR